MTGGPVLLDLDGTLVDSRPGIVAAMNETLLALGEPPRDAAALQSRIGPPLEETWAWLLGRRPTEVGPQVAAYRARYVETMGTGTHVYPGVPAMLDALAGRPLVVATSKAQPIATALLEHLGLAGRFLAIRGPVPPALEDKAATVARALVALREAGIDPSGATMLGDRLHDIHGAHVHGVRAVGVLWGYGSADELREAGADALAASPAGVPALL